MGNRTSAVLGFLAAAWPAAVQREERRRRSLAVPGTPMAQPETESPGADGPGAIDSDDVGSRHDWQAPQGARPVRSRPPPPAPHEAAGQAPLAPHEGAGQSLPPLAPHEGAGQSLPPLAPHEGAVAEAPHHGTELRPAAMPVPVRQPALSPAGGALAAASAVQASEPAAPALLAPVSAAAHPPLMRGVAPLDTADSRSLRLSAPRLFAPGRQPAPPPPDPERHGSPVSAASAQSMLAPASQHRPAASLPPIQAAEVASLPLVHTAAAARFPPVHTSAAAATRSTVPAAATARLTARAADRFARRQSLLAATPSLAGSWLAASPVAPVLPDERHALHAPQEQWPRPAQGRAAAPDSPPLGRPGPGPAAPTGAIPGAPADDPEWDVPGADHSPIAAPTADQARRSAPGYGIGAPVEASDGEPAGPPGYRLVDEAELRRMLARIIQADALRHGLDLKER